MRGEGGADILTGFLRGRIQATFRGPSPDCLVGGWIGLGDGLDWGLAQAGNS